jgi:peptidoglycan/LPS O-acetylase OafA/YrhL
MTPADTNRASSFQTSGRIPELDGLRGIAIGLVIVTHCLNVAATPQEPKYLALLIGFFCSAKSFAWSGVDLFFVLSGFLLGGRLLDTRDSPDYFKAFYARRARRILPAYLVFLGFMAFAYAFIYPLHRSAMAWPLAHPLPWYLYLTFTSNFWMAYHNTYGAWGLAVLWSLALEEQFYLVAPFLIRLVRPARLPHALATGICSSLLLRCALRLMNNHAQMALYVLLPCRIDALLWGMLAAYAARRPGVWSFLVERAGWLRRVFLVLGAGICLASFSSRLTIHSIASTTIGYEWLDLFYLSALMLVVVDRDNWLGSLTRRPWLMYLGVISYSLYLIHYTVYGLSMGYLLGRSGPIQNVTDLSVALLAIGVAVCLATLSWEFFERPILHGGDRGLSFLDSRSGSSPWTSRRLIRHLPAQDFEQILVQMEKLLTTGVRPSLLRRATFMGPAGAAEELRGETPCSSLRSPA